MNQKLINSNYLNKLNLIRIKLIKFNFFLLLLSISLLIKVEEFRLSMQFLLT